MYLCESLSKDHGCEFEIFYELTLSSFFRGFSGLLELKPQFSLLGNKVI